MESTDPGATGHPRDRVGAKHAGRRLALPLPPPLDGHLDANGAIATCESTLSYPAKRLEISQASLPAFTAALVAAGAPFDHKDAAARRLIVERFEQSERGLFDHVLRAVVLAYYEHPFVVDAIRASGRRYHLFPHFEGYAGDPFDPARDMPGHRNGHYISTSEVRRLDLTELDPDQLEPGRLEATPAGRLRRPV